MIFWVLLLYFLSQASGLDGQTDDVVGNLIKIIAGKIQFGGLNIFRIDDLELHYKYFRLPGFVRCQHGVVQFLGSLRKSGSLRVIKKNNSSILSIPLEFGNLQYYYRYCKYKILTVFKTHGSLRVTAPSNSLKLQAVVIRNGENCGALITKIKLNVNEVKVTFGRRWGLETELERLLSKEAGKYMYKTIARLTEQKLEIVTPFVIADQFFCNI